MLFLVLVVQCAQLITFERLIV